MRNKILFEKIDTYKETDEARRIGIYPFFREIISAQDTSVILKGGRSTLMLGSNSYMGLTNHPEIKEAVIAAVRKYGSGCAGSPFLNGYLDLHAELEEALASWVGKPRAAIFTTGFQANLGVIGCVPGKHDYLILDKYDHASIYEGAKLSQAEVVRYPHNNMASLAKALARIPEDRGKFIVVDGIFSMEGDIVKLPELVALAEKFGAVAMVDDAHSLGVLGDQGSGTASHFGLTDQVDFIMGTFSKSLASIGGFIASDWQAIEYLKHHARALIFSASMPPASAAAALAALKIIKREPERRTRLWHNTTVMREGLQSLGFNTGLSETPVIPVHVGDILTLGTFYKELENEGVFVNPVVPPAVPPTDCLLRISLMATHTEEQISFALDKMEKAGKKVGVIR